MSVNVALPSIADDLAFAADDLPGATTADRVLFTGGLRTLGVRWATDLLGRRRVFLAGLAMFTAASLASGLATSPEILVAARALQGLGARRRAPRPRRHRSPRTYAGGQRTAALAGVERDRQRGCGRRRRARRGATSALGWEWVSSSTCRSASSPGSACCGSCDRTPGRRRRAAARRPRRRRGGRRSGRLPVRDHRSGRARLGLGRTSPSCSRRRCCSPSSARGTARPRADHPAEDVAQPPADRRHRGDPRRRRACWSRSSSSTRSTCRTCSPGRRRDRPRVSTARRGHRRRREGGRPPDRAIGPDASAATGLVLVAAGAALLALAPDVAGYATDVLPGFLVLGFGVGIVFPPARSRR